MASRGNEINTREWVQVRATPGRTGFSNSLLLPANTAFLIHVGGRAPIDGSRATARDHLCKAI